MAGQSEGKGALVILLSVQATLGHFGRTVYPHIFFGIEDLLVFCAVKRRFAIDGKTKTHDITVTTMQAIVLLMFNNIPLDERIGYNDIKGKIGEKLDDMLVKPVLHSLACGKVRLV